MDKIYVIESVFKNGATVIINYDHDLNLLRRVLRKNGELLPHEKKIRIVEYTRGKVVSDE